MKEVYTEVEIEAPAEKVWGLLSDFANVPKWNPIIKTLKGNPEPGKRVYVMFNLKGLGPLPLLVKMLAYIPGREITWIGKAPVPWLLEGRHSFIVEPLDGGRCKFVHFERFSGIALPAVEGILDSKLKPNYEAMNRALKAEAEKK
jgi:hypothetical protein